MWMGNVSIDATYQFTIPELKNYQIPELNQTEKDSMGRICKGMIVTEQSSVSYIPNLDSNTVSKRRYVYDSVGSSNQAIAIMAIPRLRAAGYCNLNFHNVFDRIPAQYQQIEKTGITYIFIFVTNKKAGISVAPKESKYEYASQSMKISTSEKGDYEDRLSNQGTIVNAVPDGWTVKTLNNKIIQYNNESLKFSDNQIAQYPQTVLDFFSEKYGDKEWVDSIDSSLVMTTEIGIQMPTMLNGSAAGIAGNRVYTNIPVFRYDKIDDMLEYFKTGSLDGASNKDDVNYSELVATDWIVYIDGRFPTVSLTWKSEKIEDFFAEHPKENYSINDVKIDIQVPNVIPTNIPNAGIVDGWKDDVSLTYPDPWYRVSFKSFIDKIFNGYTIGDYKEKAIKLRFRMKLDKYVSSWCECFITYRGIPNDSDWGNISSDSMADGSTVTLVYGELPDDDHYVDPEDPSDVTGNDTQPSDFNMTNVLTKTYEMKEERLKQLGDFLWSSSFFDNIKLLSNSPIENIVGCKQVPINLSGTNDQVVIGNVDTGINGEVITNYVNVEIGSLKVTGIYDSFLDYSPYTQITIFLPFIGFQELDTSKFMGKTINVKYVFDLVSGACKAMLFCNDIYVQSFDGQAGIDVPLTASNRAQQDAAFIGSMIPGVSFGASLMGKKEKSTMFHSALSGNTDIAIPQYHYSTKGGYSPVCAFFETRLCYLIYNRPVVQYPSSYGHNVGYPCNLSATLSTLSGFTVIDDGIDLSGITATDAEKTEILNYLTTGIYL